MESEGEKQIMEKGFGFFFFLVFLGLYPRHMEVPRLGVESKLQLLAYTTATATRNPSLVCDLHCSSWQCQILNPLSHNGNSPHKPGLRIKCS